jgi:hypothetical protein
MDILRSGLLRYVRPSGPNPGWLKKSCIPMPINADELAICKQR